MNRFISRNSSAEQKKPINGENNKLFPTPIACVQSTPLAPVCCGAINWFISPTPRIEPMSV